MSNKEEAPAAPSIEEQEGEPVIGPEGEIESGDEEIELSDEKFEQAFQLLEVYHGQAVADRQQGVDRIRELEIIAKENAYLNALHIVAAAITGEDMVELIENPRLANDYQFVSQQARGITTPLEGEEQEEREDES